MSLKERDLYEPVTAALKRSFAAIGRSMVAETAANKGLGEASKALIPQGNEILFRFLPGYKPDIAGYVEHPQGHKTLTVEVKRGSPVVKDIYQAKLYKELFGATFGFLITTHPISEELRRLLRHVPRILMSADDYQFSFLALGQFDVEGGTFVDWFASPWLEENPFNHLKKLSF